MAESVQSGLVQATQVAREAAARRAANGVRFAAFGETGLDDAELVQMVQAVPTAVAAALGARRTTLCRWRWPRDAMPRAPGTAAATRRR